MQLYNRAARSERNSEIGLVWEEKLSGASGTIKVQKYSAVRVRAAGALTVTIAGVLAATMINGEILTFNAGQGDPTDNDMEVTIVIAGTAYVQVAKENEDRRP